MANPSITITAFSGGTSHKITLEKTGANAASASLDGGSPYNLADVHATADGLVLKCTYYLGIIPIHPVCTIQPANPPANWTVSIQAAGFSQQYQLTASDGTNLVNFLKANFYP